MESRLVVGAKHSRVQAGQHCLPSSCISDPHKDRGACASRQARRTRAAGSKLSIVYSGSYATHRLYLSTMLIALDIFDLEGA